MNQYKEINVMDDESINKALVAAKKGNYNPMNDEDFHLTFYSLCQRIAFNKFSNKKYAEDIASEFYSKVSDNPNFFVSVKDVVHLKGYLAKSIENESKDHYRHYKSDCCVDVYKNDDENDNPVTDYAYFMASNNNEGERGFSKMIKALKNMLTDERDYDIMFAKYDNNTNDAMIAEKYGISENNVRTIRNRLRNKCAKKLNELGYDKDSLREYIHLNNENKKNNIFLNKQKYTKSSSDEEESL